MKLNKSLREKRWIFSWLIFLSLFVFLFIHISYLFRPVDTSMVTHDRVKIAGYYAEEKNSLDAVFIGGSSTFCYWQAMEAYKEYGIASYNFGPSGMIAESVLPMVKETLKTQNPNLLVIDARPFQYRSERGISEVLLRYYSDNVNYSVDRLKTILTVVPNRLNAGEASNKWHYIFDISKYHTRWKSLNKVSFDYITNSHKSHRKGYRFVQKQIEYTAPNCTGITEKKAINDQTQQLLDELLDYLKKSGKEVLFVVNPYVEEPEHKQIYNHLEEQIVAAGFDFIDVNDLISEIGIDYSTDMLDINHVNIFGAEKYTRFIGKYIKENYDLPDRRNDPAYASWNEDYARWKVEADSTKEATIKFMENSQKK